MLVDVYVFVFILLVDFGGINVCFGVVDLLCVDLLLKDSICCYWVVEYELLVVIVKQYLVDIGFKVKCVIVVVVGCIEDGEMVKVINNLWVIFVYQIVVVLDLDVVYLVNDFVVQSMVVILFKGDDLVCVGELLLLVIGEDEEQIFVIVGFGIGLGVGGLLVCQGYCSVLQIEGGYVGFVVYLFEDIVIFDYFNYKYGCVFNEWLICGQGLVNLYDVICYMVGVIVQLFKLEDIIVCVKDGSCLLCMCMVEIFVGIFGSVVGDLVFMLGVWNGVYFIGGLILILLLWLECGCFCECFEVKGCFCDIMQKVFIQVIMNFELGLFGVVVLVVMELGCFLFGC